MVLVTAAGNSGTRNGTGDTVDYPGRTGIPIAVAATQRNDARYTSSASGPEIDLAAPGVAVTSTYGTGYATWTGTSAASPHVAGAAALLLQARSGLSNDKVRDCLQGTAQDLGASGRDQQFGQGMVRADLAISSRIEACVP